MKLLKGFLQGFTSMLIAATLFIGCLRVGKVFYENYDINSSLTWIVTLISLTISLVVFWALITYIDILEDKKRLENELVLLRSDKHHLVKVLDATREDYIKQMDLKDEQIDQLTTTSNIITQKDVNGAIKNLTQAPFAHDSAPETSIIVCPVCNSPMRETAKMYICDSAVGHKKQWRKEELQ